MSDLRERVEDALWLVEDTVTATSRRRAADALLAIIEQEMADNAEALSQAQIQLARQDAKLEDYTRTIDDLMQWKHDHEQEMAALRAELLDARADAASWKEQCDMAREDAHREMEAAKMAEADRGKLLEALWETRERLVGDGSVSRAVDTIDAALISVKEGK